MQSKAYRPKFHIFDDKKYQIIWKKPDSSTLGLCDSPKNSADERKIWIAPSLSLEERLETMIHEAIHAELWCLDEDTVVRMGRDISSFLLKCGVTLMD